MKDTMAKFIIFYDRYAVFVVLGLVTIILAVILIGVLIGLLGVVTSHIFYGGSDNTKMITLILRGIPGALIILLFISPFWFVNWAKSKLGIEEVEEDDVDECSVVNVEEL